MSYTRDGDEVETPLHKQIAAYEDLPAKMVWSPTGERRGNAEELSAVDIPSDIKTGEGDGTSESLNAVVKEQERLAKDRSAVRSKA